MELFAELNGKVLNPDKATLGAIVARCAKNDGYCPCKPYKDADHLCPCVKMREEGECCCTLYVDKNHPNKYEYA